MSKVELSELIVSMKWQNALRKLMLRTRLRNPFTIVSNNCWGAHIYQQLGHPYQTPFVGLFVVPADYLMLLSNFRMFLSEPLTFVPLSRHAQINASRQKRQLSYPIGRLGDEVEIQFLHYRTEHEAANAWSRRLQRICQDDDQLYFKFCDRDGCTSEQLAQFDSLPFAHKVCFVSSPSPSLNSTVWIPNCTERQVPDGLQLSRISPRFFDAAGWVNGTDGSPRWWNPLRCV